MVYRRRRPAIRGSACAAAALALLAYASTGAHAQSAAPSPFRRPGDTGDTGITGGTAVKPSPDQFRIGGETFEFEVTPPRRAFPPLLPLPDRWRIVEDLGVKEHWWDPYNQSTLKSDRPVIGNDWFFSLGFISDTVVEPRRLPTPIGVQATDRPGEIDVFGNGDQLFFNQNFILSLAMIQGDTSFRPPDWEFRITTIGNINYLNTNERGVVNVNPDHGTDRLDSHVAIQELFVDRHLRNKSENYDFDSLRVGIQPFISDFRGFLFFDSQPGVRLFGNWFANRLQYNLAAFWLLEKDTNSGLNTVFDIRDDQVFAANAFLQDFLTKGFTLEGVVFYDRNREGDRNPHYNTNGFLQRPLPAGDEMPHNYDVVYPGIGGDGHIGRLNLTTNLYFALGHDDHNPIAQRSQTIFSWLLATEGSVDFDWYRLKSYVYHAKGDGNPYDGTAGGFDAIFENPNFAGASTSFWVRQGIPFVAGGGVLLKDRSSLLSDLRSSKLEGQSNFVNPGLTLAGVGADFDIYPELRVLANAFWLGWDDTSSLRALRQQRGVAQDIGYDLSVGVIYRPLFIENVVFNVSGAALIPGQGFKDIYAHKYDVFYSTLFNMILTY
jgi:hypothetical protein